MDDQSDDIQGETRPIVVRFSISKDTDDDPHDGVYDWQTPDFMTESLFAIFLTEIVDAVSDWNTQKFLQLLDPFSASWNDLRRWNQKQNKWFDHDGDKMFSKVRKACNEKRIGDFISLRPSQGTVRNIDVRINSEIDPFGELRIEINQLKASREPEVLEETGDDKYPSDDEEEAIDEEVQANPEKPNCYYPSQEKMAAILKKRIDKIMSHYHGISRLSDAFNDVEFAVYTARYKMLCDQTKKRIHHPNAGVLSKEELESREDGSGKKRMFMYVHSKVTEDHFKQLQRKVQDKPDTLFVIIADECHWGITKDKEEKSSAHNLFINEWCKGSPRNVVVIQISATPFNLLTQNSRLPLVKCVLLNDKVSTTLNDYEAGDLVVQEREPNLEEHVRKNSKEVELHVVHWSEVELENFETGIRMKLKSALNIKDTRYLHVSPDRKLTTVEDDATNFIVQGTHGIVILQALVSKELLTVSRDAHGNLEAKVDPQQPTKFQVKLEFGVGVVAFCSCENTDQYLAVNEHGNVTLEAAAVERKWGVSIMKPKAKIVPVSFQFYTEVIDVAMAGQQYMSLNYYLSTINCSNKSDQKIREDESFQKMAKRQKKMTDSSSFPIDAFLCAEYCYHILHVSVYNSDEKICQALTSPADESPAAEFDRRLDSFICKLEEGPETSKIEYIHPKAFKLVREQLHDEAASDFKENVKKVAQLLKNKSSKEIQGEYEVLATSFVACLMYLSQQEMQQIKEETHLNSIIENMTQTLLQANDCQKMVKTWNCIVEDSETLSLVKNLIQSGKGKLGKMKIVRAKSTKNANQFYHTLQLARKESSLENCFEIIRDYGEIQIEKQLMKPSSPFFQKLQPDICMYRSDCSCSERKQQLGCQKCANCHHVHKVITQYEDLENLACVLILVEKGRMGDTFPHSFDCLDLRLSYDSSREYLSTLIQELGRLCRYVKVSVHESHVDHTPYVLVGKELFKKIKASLNKSPSMCAVDCTSVDRYMTVANKKASTSTSKETASFPLRWLNYEAQKDSYDHQNQETHCNRILLQAEPQIGKTGSYLCLIKYLREDILGMENDSSKSPAAFDEGTIYRHKECHPSTIDVVNDNEGAYDWNFPYWKTIEDSPSLSVKPVAPGKYSIGGCFYTHDKEEFPYDLMKSGQSNPSKSTRHLQMEDFIADDMRAWHWYHFKTCAECRIRLQGKESVLGTLEANIDGKLVIVKYSLPSNHPSYNHLLEQFQSTRSTEEAFSGFNSAAAVGNAPSLAYWIFHPSHRDDPRKCTFNYHHVMQENDQVASHVQVAVVRSEKFDEYRTFWGKVLAIFQLPENLPTSNCERGPSTGGVGYARLFIQKIANFLKLEYVFVIDDNTAVMKEADLSASEDNVSRDENGVMGMKRCSFFKPLNHLQKIVQGKDIPFRGEETYESHPLKEHFEAHQLPLYNYTGPAKLFGDKQHNSYGVLGLLRSVPRAVNPFSKTQVYAAILLNVKSTVEKGVFYRPWPFWEDLRFNDDCDKAGLWVVKCNRYHFLKVQYNDWIKKLIPPSIFEWKDDTILEKRPKTSKLHKEEEEGIILEHLRNFVNSHGPDKCFKGTIGYDRQEESEDTMSPTRIVEDKRSPASRVVEQLEVREGTEEAFANGIPVFILSYCTRNTHKNINLLYSRFCSTKEKIVFVTGAKEAIKRWPQMMLATIPTERGICSYSEMSDRNAQFAIFSAADPRRHRLRYFLIEASFPQQEETNAKGMNTATEENTAEKSQVYTRNEPNVKENTLLKRSLKESSNDSVKSKRPKRIDDYSQPATCADEVSNRVSITNYDKEFYVSRTLGRVSSKGRDNIQEEGYGHEKAQGDYEILGNGKRKSLKTGSVAEKVQHKNEESEISRNKSHGNMSVALREEGLTNASSDISMKASTSKLQKMLGSEERDEQTEDGCSNAGAFMNLKQHEEVTLVTSKRNVLCTEAGDEASDSEKSKKRRSKNPAKKIEPSDPAYMEGTNDVTKRIVDLWRKYRLIEQKGSKDLTTDVVQEKPKQKGIKDLTTAEVQEKLNSFSTDELQTPDEKGYDALLKACCLPSMSPHVMQYLITERKVDLNCQVSSDFDKNYHEIAKGLIPGMSALSVAIRKRNVKSVPTFMTRLGVIKIRSIDQEGNTALHHCVLSNSKISFQKLFTYFKPLEWKEMRNNDLKNPLDICLTMEKELRGGSKVKEKSLNVLMYMRKEMERASA